MSSTSTMRGVQYHKATIASGASLSNAIQPQGLALFAIQMPSTWTAAAITFQGSYDGTTYGDVYDDGGTEVTIASANAVASRVIVNGSVLEKLAALPFVKIRSGTTGSPVNQGQQSIVYLLGKA